MSGHCVERVLDSGLDDRLKDTAVAVATYAAHDGSSIWPSVEEIARRSNQSERTVQYHLKQLRIMQVIVITQKATARHPAHYRLLLENLPPRRTVKRDVPTEQLLAPLEAPPGVQRVTPLDPRGANSASRGATWVAPDPSQEGSVTSPERAAAPPQRAPAPEVQIFAPLPPDGPPDLDADYTAVVTAVVTKDILPRRMPDEALMAATLARCAQLQIPCTEDVLRKAIDSALFRYYRALRLVADLPPDPRGIYHDHVAPQAPRLPMPIGLKRSGAKRGRR